MFADFRPAPNQRRVELYELENRAMDPAGAVLDAMRAIAPWSGHTLVDLGCGSGRRLDGYAAEAARVIGVEPDPTSWRWPAGAPPTPRCSTGRPSVCPSPTARWM